LKKSILFFLSIFILVGFFLYYSDFDEESVLGNLTASITEIISRNGESVLIEAEEEMKQEENIEVGSGSHYYNQENLEKYPDQEAEESEWINLKNIKDGIENQISEFQEKTTSTLEDLRERSNEEIGKRKERITGQILKLISGLSEEVKEEICDEICDDCSF